METLEIDPHLRLLPIQEPHATELYKLLDKNRAYLREWLPWLDQQTRTEHTQAFARNAHRRNAGGEALVQVIFYRQQLCGVSGFNFIDQANRWGEIGYWLDESTQGRGVITRTVQAQMNHGFKHLKLHRISISVATGNVRSRAIPERLGFRFEGILRQSEWLYDRFVDHALYARLATD